MPLPGGEVQLKQSVISLTPPLTNRAYTTATITAGTAIAVGATSVSLTSSVAATKLYAGQALSFVAATTPTRRQQIVILDDATLSTTASTVNVFPVTDAIASSSTATFVQGSIPLLGVQDFSLQSSDQNVDTTNLLSGFGTEMALVRSGKTFNVSGIQIPFDRCLETVVKQILLNGANFGKETYAEVTLPDGETYSGVAKLANWQAGGNQNEVKKFSFELTMMGSSFSFRPAYLFT